MALKKEPFINYTLDKDKKEEKRKVIPVSFNLQELKQLDEDMKNIYETQRSKAIKQFMMIGQIVIHEQKTMKIIDILFKNKKNSQRRGITEF